MGYHEERDEKPKKRPQYKGHMQLRRQLTMSREEAEERAAEEMKSWSEANEGRRR